MGQLAPDWWMRGVTQSGRRNAPCRDISRNASKGGGAKNGAERRGGAPCYKRADEESSKGPFVHDGVVREREKVPVREFLLEGSCSRVPVREFLLEGSCPRVRRSRCGPETPLVGWSVRHSSPDPEYRQFPPSIRAEIAPETPFVPQPNRGVERSTRACAKHELTDHAGGAGS